MVAKKESLEHIDEIGPVMAESITAYFSLPQTKKLIEDLRKMKINFIEHSDTFTAAMPLSGKTIVFTGELEQISRQEAESLVRRAGGNASSSVSGKTDFVVAGDNPGSKYEKAKTLKVRIIDEKEFMKLAHGS
jgi:DNA ligase (NAD+)